MSDLTSSLATLAERLGTRLGPARGPDGVEDGVRVEGAINLAGILAVPLDRFACDGQLLEIRVPWLDVTLWFAPEERDADALFRGGVSRGRVWTTMELMDVVGISARTREALRTIALAKHAFDGDIAAVIPRSGG
jgi:hypothetical protein